MGATVMLTISIADAQDAQEVGVQLQPAAPEALGRQGAHVQLPQRTFSAPFDCQRPCTEPPADTWVAGATMQA